MLFVKYSLPRTRKISSMELLPKYNISGLPSNETDLELLKKMSLKTYQKLLPCLKDSWFMDYLDQLRNCITAYSPIDSWKLPNDVYDHYHYLLTATEPFRSVPVHSYLGYKGPWIENFFIENFIGKPLAYFNGLIPLFIQFVDLHVYQIEHANLPNGNLSSRKNISDYLISLLRDDCVYIVVSQDDQGISEYLYRFKFDLFITTVIAYCICIWQVIYV